MTKLRGLYFSLYLNTGIAIVIWLVMITASLMWGIITERDNTRNLVKNTARSHCNKDQAFRFWGTSHGGVYVPIDEKTPPNPYLKHIPERDITTKSGKHLTLMNPAYMVRQMMEQYAELYGIKGRITSLKVLNPLNAPDEWERKALKNFERGVEEVFEFTEINNKPFLRLMRPMVTKEGCLKCHGHQGYKVGDIRGGVGVSVSVTPFLSIGKGIRDKMILSHAFIGLVGLIVIGFISVLSKQRIDERISSQDKLQRAHDELEIKVKERTHELSEANVRLMELDHMKSMFIASMSHELRTPLNSIIGFSGMILEGLAGDVTPEIKDYIRRINRSGQHLLPMISDVLDISKLESGKVDVNAEHFNLNKMVKEAIDEITTQANHKKIVLKASVPDNLEMFTDRTRLFQCVLNLLSNSMKFTESGEIRIMAKEYQGHIEISVSDTGIGISNDNVQHIFDAFERLDSPLKIKAGGSGLGLYLTKKLITEVLKGEIKVESEEGKGSVFRLKVPREVRL